MSKEQELLCPYIYPNFMGKRDTAIERADNAFFEAVGRWANSMERTEYIALIDAGVWPGEAGYAIARKASHL